MHRKKGYIFMIKFWRDKKKFGEKKIKSLKSKCLQVM